MSDHEDHHRSFADQLGDALSPDPSRRTAAGDIFADQVSQAMANDLAGNHPSELERGVFGHGSFASQQSQSMLDDIFRDLSKEE